jgi:ribosome-binding ATPase YchF (GTP1/OBG family)
LGFSPKGTSEKKSDEKPEDMCRQKKGWLRVEGKEYVIADGDVVHFRFAN